MVRDGLAIVEELGAKRVGVAHLDCLTGLAAAVGDAASAARFYGAIEAVSEQLGYRLVYEPKAIVYNRGPTTVRDFLRQRRRIYAGHLRVAEQQGYAAPTMKSSRVLRALLGSGSLATPRAFVWSLGTVGLEAMFAGPICGASMNPARSIAPALMSGHLASLWIYILAPLLGAAIAVPCWLVTCPQRAEVGP